MKVGVITGASSGLGREFALRAEEAFPEIERFFLIARRKDRLEETAKLLKKPAEILPLDLTAEGSVEALTSALSSCGAEVCLLINNSGMGVLGEVKEADPGLQMHMCDLNVRALTGVTAAVLKFMKRGGRIINVSSIASFVPNARMTVYSSTKAYVTSFSRGLRQELKKEGIGVTAVCPGPMDTEFLDVGGVRGQSPMFKKLPYCKVPHVVKGALRAAKRGRAVYTDRLFFKFYRVLAKVLPHAWLIPFVKT